MKTRTSCYPSLTAALAMALALLLPALTAQAKNVSQTAMAGGYTIDLKVLPAESFMGAHAAMTRDGGAMAVPMNGRMHPNHHLVVFLRKNGKPVENAKVTIRYRELSPKMGKWMRLPVTRMYATGHGRASTHYGNNVWLGPGKYEARVTVNSGTPATFHFAI